ncbi:uncharacterized protein N7515_006242 [Penicillium bovifimosum]|uniref:Uncharacterized protein n=1 Tax=Penicillium bovifimosum TaxID=126998 RepID=A0A9W9KZJ9_9EURO|nr:uncharacterized protein N7515_006242 [Penicillium bovifimosum]KAJ5130203.1 hypothetical protein N7515_006242 [Penicillium bovifimosum]
MAPLHSFILFLSFVLSPLVLAAPWIVTDVYEQNVVTDYYGRSVTNVDNISPTATLPAEALSTITSTNTYEDYTVIQKLYPTGYGVERGYEYNYLTLDTDGAYHTTVYKVNLTFSAPTACSTQWTTTTAVQLTPPLRSGPTTYIYEVVYVEPTQVPSSDLSSLKYWNAPTSLYTGPNCKPSVGSSSDGTYSSYPPDSGYTPDYPYSGYYGNYWGDDGNWFTSKWGLDIGISPLALTLIISLGWIGLVFIFGMIEAWVRFRRLMTGWQTRRGLPLFWAFILLPFSLFFLFCFRKGYRARSKEDAAILRKKWNAMSFWTKLRLYFAWGFRFKYPTVLGPAPPHVKASKRPDQSGPRLLEPTPPGTATPSPAGSQAHIPTTGPEMGEASNSRAHPVAAPVASGALSGHDEEIGHAR